MFNKFTKLASLAIVLVAGLTACDNDETISEKLNDAGNAVKEAGEDASESFQDATE